MATAANMPAQPIVGNVSPQDKILYVANKLGLSSLKYMQATTRCVYDSVDYFAAGSPAVTLFEGATSRSFPATNLDSGGNRFEVNEALLVEKIAFFKLDENGNISNIANQYGTGMSVKFDMIIGNKTVMKDCVVETGGMDAFFSDGTAQSSSLNLEGAGILIPPQVEFKVVAKGFITDTRLEGLADPNLTLGCYLYGTGVLLNFNTSI